jgi:diguanylate cyclase (GGDEF)-like protein/PAS domain S-box-containing protein
MGNAGSDTPRSQVRRPHSASLTVVRDVAKVAENDAAFYQSLLESTKAIPWKIDWATMRFTYIGPQIKTLLGWAAESWLTVQDWADRMHPDERERTVAFCVAQSQAGADHEADYRALTRDGSYVWIRDVVHVVRDEAGEVSALVGFMFDITERKRNEEAILKLQAELQALSYQDGLTGLANRRSFDSQFATEWQSARRNPLPLSLILFDIDFFKPYNDHYGHVRGDDCLRRVANALRTGVTRPRDFLSRYGGEEFALLLPETDAAGAEQVAKKCLAALFEAAIPHAASEASTIVTMSAGIGTIIPAAVDAPLAFIERVDKRLYQAKQSGRNTLIFA